MNRRRFFRTLGGVGLAAAFPSIVRAQTLGLGGGTAPSNRLTVGFVGGGGISGGHVAHVTGDKSLQLVAMADVDRNTLQFNKDKISQQYAERDGTSGYDGLRLTKDFREVVNDPSIDVIFNCTPDHWHALPLIYAARAGKSIYSEKPLSRTAEEGVAMVAAVERAGVVCQIGSQQRSSNEFIRAISLVRNGALGKIKRVEVGLPSQGGQSHAFLSPAPENVPDNLDYEFWTGPAQMIPYHSSRVHFNWRWRYEYAGGQLTDWINHHYDIAQIALGVSDEIPHTISNIEGQFALQQLFNTASDYSFHSHYSNNRVIEVSSRTRMGIRFEGEDGWLYVNRGEMEYSSKVLKSMALPTQGWSPSGSATEHRQNFFDCIRSRTKPRSRIDQAHNTAMVGHLVNAALRAGAAQVKWDAASGKVVEDPAVAAQLRSNYRGPWHLPA
ncbi:MAG: Gfo/Idh/MocA family oxidoreductase [Opitutaceae bacterium]|nr:Gfo/Idh/MocA family oxidoreductase [Opitutaceae bacterium]